MVYVTGEPEAPYQAAMTCPCGCHDTIWLDLGDFGDQFWTVSFGRQQAATLSPSVWCTDGCGSHFWLRNGRIEWCSDQGRRRRSAWIDGLQVYARRLIARTRRHISKSWR